jgi:uncharacterized protein
MRILKQHIKASWQWILIPLLLVGEFIIDQFILPAIYLPIIRHLAITEYSRYMVYLNIYKIGTIIIISLLNYIILRQKFFWKPNFQEIGWMVFVAISVMIFILGIQSHNFWIATDVGILAAIPEELLFRGVILGKLLSMIKSTRTNQVLVNTAVMGSALLFGLYHYINLGHQSFGFTTIQVINAMGIGLVLAVIYVKSGSILIPMTLHLIYDYAVTLLHGMPMQQYMTINSVQVVGILFWFAIYASASLGALNYHYENNQLLRKIDTYNN